MRLLFSTTLFSLFVMLAPATESVGQVMHVGIKSGFNLSWVRLDDIDFRETVSVRPVPGFNAGAVATFKMKERFFLHAEALYSTKGKTITGGRDLLNLKDRQIFTFVDVPLTYNVFFNAQLKLKNIKRFKWYVGAGPNFSYWLGGRGTISNLELKENEVEEVSYKIRFGSRGESQREPEIVYVSDVNRWQLGLNFGGGILVEPLNGSKIMLDLKFELGHTWMGTPESANYAMIGEYHDNLQARNMGCRLSLMYMLEFSTDKKIMNKGKSTGDRKKKRR